MKWVIEPEVEWATFDDSSQWVAYCIKSADVHLLNDGAHALWLAIEANPGATAEQLLASPPWSLDRNPNAQSALIDTLHSMDRAGLVQPVLE